MQYFVGLQCHNCPPEKSMAGRAVVLCPGVTMHPWTLVEAPPPFFPTQCPLPQSSSDLLGLNLTRRARQDGCAGIRTGSLGDPSIFSTLRDGCSYAARDFLFPSEHGAVFTLRHSGRSPCHSLILESVPSPAQLASPSSAFRDQMKALEVRHVYLIEGPTT